MTTKSTIVDLKEEPRDNLISLYISAYSGHPWHEQFECGNCGVTYSDGCEKNAACEEFVKRDSLYLKKGKFCGNCGEELEKCLKPMWTKEVVNKDFEDALNQECFIGNGIKSDKDLVGFFWGFKMPKKDTHHVWYEKASKILEAKSIDPNKTFYHTEIGIKPSAQGKGLGKDLLFNSLKEVSKEFNVIVYRTINPVVNHLYSAILSKEANPLFRDPNPAKDQSWYAFDIKHLKEKEGLK